MDHNTKTQAAPMERNLPIALIGGVLVALLLVLGNVWQGNSAKKSTEEAVHSVSDFYLQELAGRREQVVASNLNASIKNMETAIGLLTREDLSDLEHLQAFQSRMRKLYEVEKFAFVDANGLIYTATGTQNNITDYSFDPLSITGPEISIKNLESAEKKVVIAVPVDKIPFLGQSLVAAFMEIDVHTLLEGLSLQTDANSTTFCNLYYKNGVSLTNVVLGGQASGDNLLAALREADFPGTSSLAQIEADFRAGHEGVIAFTYHDMSENMYYTPVAGTDWMLTYLIRDSIISEQINTISEGIIRRSLMQTLAIAVVMLAAFAAIIAQNRRTAQLRLEREKADAENWAIQQEMEERLALQDQLLAEERQRRQADAMITAMASDYRSVYYIDLDKDEGICYRADEKEPGEFREGDRFWYQEAISRYAESYVAEADRDEFLEFAAPENIRMRLETEAMISHRYLSVKGGKEHYEMLRVAGVRHAEDRDDHIVHAVGIGFSNVDEETREAMAKSRALSDALAQAQEANAAKTSFLSSMSHEIRTPMNAIIGLNSIALKDPELPERTREHLEKIGGSAKHLLSLINDILDMSRIESGRMTLRNEEFSFREMLEQINTMISGQCQDKGLAYDCEIVGHVDDYYIGDDMKLKQVLINILGNSVKFTPAGGTVSFIVEPTAHFEDNVTMRFTMKDTGVGMDKSFLPRIFEAFAQEDENKANKYGSTGLGMAITKNIVEMMNGKIEVDSEKGVGSTFAVTVTLKASDKREHGGTSEVRPQDLRVLIIDDDPVACEHAQLILDEVGIVSDACNSGREGYELLQMAQARQMPYNLILVDLRMPEQDGVEVTRTIREKYDNQSAIIILTAYNWDDIIEEALDAGVDSFLAKPLFASNVLQEFKQAIGSKYRAQAEMHKADLAGKHILLAEDMEINAEIMMEILQMRDMTVDHAENGQIAVDMFAKSAVGAYDAVLMDVRMPVLDGLGATEAIRALDRPDAKAVPIIAMTANAFDEDVQRSLQAGMNAHLSKPVEPERLFETLETLIRE